MPVRNQAIDPATSYACKGAYDLSRETGFANNDPISTLTDQSAYAKNLTGSSTARPLYISNQLNGYGVARFDGSNDILTAATAADWKWLHDGHGFTVLALLKQTDANPAILNPIIDTTGTLSSAQIGVALYLDDRVSVPRNNGAALLVAKGSSGNALAAPVALEVMRPQTWQLVTARYQYEARAVEQFSLAAHAAEIFVDGLSVAGGVGANAPHSTSNPSATLSVGSVSTFFAKMDLAGLWLFDTALADDLLASYVRWIMRRFDYDAARPTSRAYGYHAFPALIDAGDGTILNVHCEESMHDSLGRTTRLVGLRSSNEGWDWSLPEIVYQHATKTTSGAGGFKTRAGTILVSGFTDDGSTDIDAFVLRSTDKGRTWSAPITPTHGLTLWSAGIGQFCELSNGNLLLALYGRLTAGTISLSKLVVSTDDGATWGSAVTIADGPGSSKQWNETGLIKISGTYPNETILAMIRNDTDNRIDKATSTDSGATWGSKTSALAGLGGMPFLLKEAATGYLYCFCRQRTSPARAVCHFSTDSGATWSAADYNIDAIPGFNAYMSALERSAGRFLVSVSSEIAAQSGNPTMALLHSRTHRADEIRLFT